MYARLSTHAYIYAEISPPAVRKVMFGVNISKIAQAMFEAQPQRSLATPEHFQVCECKSTTAIPVKKRKKVAANFHSYVTI